MSYTNGWTWLEDATEEQMENEARCNSLYAKIRELYDSVPDPSADAERLDRILESIWEAAFERHSDLSTTEARAAADKAVQHYQQQQTAKTQLLWDQIEFFETKLSEAGARLRRPYEHWNEDEQRMSLMEQ